MKTKNTFKRIFVALMSTALLMSASCSFGGGDDDKPEPKTLTEKISASDGTLDLKGQAIAEDAFISRKDFTLKNADLGGKILTVTKPGAVLENISNANIIVDESVGDGDFTMKGCKDIINLTVNGGGSNSVHISDSKIQSLVVTKTSVRIVLEGAASVASAEVKADSIKLEGNANSTVAKISMSNAVSAISIKGGSIQKIITLNAVSIKIESSETSINSVTSSSTVSIEKAEGVVIKEPEVLENATIGDDYEEVKETEKPEEEPEEPKKEEEEEEEEEAPIPEIFKIENVECDTGLRIRVKNLDDTDVEFTEKANEIHRIDIYLDGVKVAYDIPKIGSTYEFYCPFVEAGKEVAVIATYCRGTKNEIGQELTATAGTGKGKITPAGGCGKLLPSGIDYEFSERGILTVKSMPSLSSPNVKSYNVVFDIASGYSYNDNSKISSFELTPAEIPAEKDIYAKGSLTNTAKVVSIMPYLVISYNDSELGREWSMRQNILNSEKHNLKLMSLEERKELEALETITVTPVEWDGGIRFRISNVDFSEDKNIEDDIWINIDDQKEQIIDNLEQDYYYPFVNPGEEVTVQIIHECVIKDDNGNQIEKIKKATSPKVKMTPAGGLGKVVLSGDLEYTADEYGTLDISAIPTVTPADLEWAVQFDFAQGKSWDDGGLWRGKLTLPSERLLGKANYYLDGWTAFSDSIDHGFIGPVLLYYWTDPEGYRHNYRFGVGDKWDKWYKYNYRLKSFDEMLSKTGPLQTIKVEVKDTANGILIEAKDRTGENPYRFLTTSNNDQLKLVIDDHFVSIIGGNWGGDLKHFIEYPFVTPGKEIKIRLEHYQEDWNQNDEIVKIRTVEFGETKYTPTSGRGEIRYEGDFEYTVDTDGYGMVTVTKTPTITPALREGETWKLFFNFYDVKNGDRMWYGEVRMPKEDAEDGIPCNVYDTAKGYVNNFSGFDSGIVEPYIVYYVINDDGSTSEFRSYCFSDAILENVKLQSKNQVIAALGEDFSGFGN